MSLFSYSTNVTCLSRLPTAMPSSPEAIYHAIPQAPVAVNPAFFEAEPDRDDDDAVQPVLDARTRQVQFILGCAVLLPWNGSIRKRSTHS